MYINDYKAKLNRNRIRIGNTDYYVADKVNDILDMLSTSCIRWDEDDFKSQAILATSDTEWEEYYNKNAFSHALTEMIRCHDASIGITWDTVDYYLDTYCKIKEYKNLYEKK